jgi:hypothetical protein
LLGCFPASVKDAEYSVQDFCGQNFSGEVDEPFLAIFGVVKKTFWIGEPGGVAAERGHEFVQQKKAIPGVAQECVALFLAEFDEPAVGNLQPPENFADDAVLAILAVNIFAELDQVHRQRLMLAGSIFTGNDFIA